MRERLDNFGGHCGGGTPLPIPNRAVKPASADGTRRATSRESRSPPNYSWNGPRERPVLLSGTLRALMGCVTCDLTEGRGDVPGGVIHATDHWIVDHCF